MKSSRLARIIRHVGVKMDSKPDESQESLDQMERQKISLQEREIAVKERETSAISPAIMSKTVQTLSTLWRQR